MKYFLFISLSSFLFCCNSKQSNEGKSQKETSSTASSTQTKEIKQEKEIDNEVLTMKKDKTLEDDLLMLKNVAFCKCLGQEGVRIEKKKPNTYKWIPDATVGGYVQCSEHLDIEWIVANPTLDKLVENWLNKSYYKTFQEKEPSKRYPTYMKCLDFYNSKALKKYLDSVRVVLQKRYKASDEKYCTTTTKTDDICYDTPLLQKKIKNKEDKLLILKNIAFCNCMEYEYEQIVKENPDLYSLFIDRSREDYITYGGLDANLIKNNLSFDRLVKEWHKKEYNAYPADDNREKRYLTIMKCIDFYNSKKLELYIDSLRVKEKEL